ncbi:MAG: histone deacetylase [Akkermansiaceae bacterium]|nr:histone deacetylase [Akkermansiaceae bacterium]MCF7731683.1 histone deacetylase [Akkermansiaceae bacterium]
MNGGLQTGVHYDADYERHDTGPGHPESAQRYRVLRKALEGLPPEIVRLEGGRRATVGEVLMVHDANYHDVVYRDAETFADFLRTGDTAICEDSYDVALEACGAVLSALDAVMEGRVARVFCAVRPPGHHATANRGMGFCIFNHVAVGARYVQQKYGVGRVAIIDWDVHHGNGTEEIFIEDPDVLYISLHEEHIYPYTGSASVRGRGPGEGANLNIPLPHGSTGEAALAAWEAWIEPAVDGFKPEMLLVSAGFDARKNDPIGGLLWNDDTFAELTRRAVQLARRWGAGRLVSVLEGGYQPTGLAAAAVAHVLALGD